MIPIIIDNFLNEELINIFLHKTENNDYAIDKISRETGHHFISCNKFILEYNKKSKTESLINHIVQFIHSIKSDISLDLNDITSIEYWNKHTSQNESGTFHIDSDEQNLLYHHNSQLSVVFYFKKHYENGLLLINKSKSEFVTIGKKKYEINVPNDSILYKTEDELINDKEITDNFYIVKPKFNSLVLFYGGEYLHGISKVKTSRDSLVLNLWNVRPSIEEALQQYTNNIYIIKKVMDECDIYEIKKFMDYISILNKQTILHDYINIETGKKIDNLIFFTITKCSKYLQSLQSQGKGGNLPNITKDTGYRLLKADTTVNVDILQCESQYFYVILTFEDIEVDFTFFNKVTVKKNSIIFMPYSWNYKCKINIHKENEYNPYIYILTTGLK